MNKVSSDIIEFEKNNDLNGLGSYLINLAKYGDNPIQYENIFNKYFDSEYYYLRKAAVFCLLFVLKIENPNYKSKAVEFVNNIDEDIEVRRWAAAALSVTYASTKDKLLLRIFYNITQSPNEDKSLRESIFSSMLNVYGVTSRDQLFRSSKISPKLFELTKTFKRELTEIDEFIK